MSTNGVIAEYIWLDGEKGPEGQQFRSKQRYIPNVTLPQSYQLHTYEQWSFDGSSTYQAETKSSDLILHPQFVWDASPWYPSRTSPIPIRAIFCEVLDATTKQPIENQWRIHLIEWLHKYEQWCIEQDPWFGLEQEYIISRQLPQQSTIQPYVITPSHNSIIGSSIIPPQGPYYCGIGLTDGDIWNRVVQKHFDIALENGFAIAGINREVAVGQYEFQTTPGGPLYIADNMIKLRWGLSRLAEDYNLRISYHPKPYGSEWNGSGCHINFSTEFMRTIPIYWQVWLKKYEELNQVMSPMTEFGVGNELRLTGQHETSSFGSFRFGSSDRSASVRIPPKTNTDGVGYLEDRRPASNINPYRSILWMCQALHHVSTNIN